MSELRARDRAGLYRPVAWQHLIRCLVTVVEVGAALLLVADLLVVMVSVLGRYLLDAAAALARGENAGVTFFVDRLSPRRREQVDAAVAVVVVAVAAALCWYT